MSETVQLMLQATCEAATADPLAAALGDVAVSCVLITPPTWRPPTLTGDPQEALDHPAYDPDQCRALVDLIQRHDTAALIANDAAMAATTGADGCHFDTVVALEETYRNARALLGANAILGAMPGTSRHTAMTLAESSADYIGYTVSTPSDDVGLEHVAWWAEIFESPVVAFTDGDLATCRQAIERGPPDFLAVPLLVDGATEHLQPLARLIAESGQLPIAAKDAK